MQRAPAGALAILLACTPAEPTPAPAREPDPREAKPLRSGEILVLRSSCYGPCPVDLTLIAANGRIHYFGRESTERTGLHTARVDPVAVDAVLELARDRGYFDTEHDYEAPVTDKPTLSSSVVLADRHHWVRNYGAAAPAAVAEVEHAALALLDAATWDESATWARTADGCKALGKAILERCDDALSMAATGGDCGHWLGVWDELGEPKVGDDARAAICSRQLESLALGVRAEVKQRTAAVGVECGKWVDRRLRPCREALGRGKPAADRCAPALRRAALLLRNLDDTELTPKQRVGTSEALCELSR